MTTEIKLCMGSSCFARGNNELLEFIEEYVKTNDLDAVIELSGCRCINACDEGPNIYIDGVLYHGMTREKLLSVLQTIKPEA